VIAGLSAFPVTPMSADGVVDTEALQRLLAPLVAAGVESIGLLGSTGSYAYLSRTERGRAVRAAVECVAGRVPILVGIGALRTDEAVALARDARAAGAQAGLLAPVSYTPLLDDEVYEHFRAVSEAGLPLCIYNNPATTHFSFTPDLVGRLSGLSQVVAVKYPAPAAGEASAVLSLLRARVRRISPSGSASIGTQARRYWRAAMPGTACWPDSIRRYVSAWRARRGLAAPKRRAG